jgi:serine/threonine-protein kinase
VVDPLVGGVLDGRYRIEDFLARGGMATIYRGMDLRLDRTVAIKIMHPSFASDPGFVERFEREARAAARLNSAFVVGVHDQGNDSGITYLIMEYVPGRTVRDVLRAHGPLAPARALAIVDPVLEALAAAHRAGYVHRDIKPENVLISDDGRVRVTDFGLARAIEGPDSGRTQGLLLGTVAYLSPEQVEHDRTDARSDVYSTGILLFELLTGQVPFSAAAPMQVAYRHVHEDVPAPSALSPGMPAGIDALVVRATRRPPGERFPDAAAFLAEVRAQRAALPAVPPWAPTPHDTLVTGRAPSAGAARAAGAAPEAGAAVAPPGEGSPAAAEAVAGAALVLDGPDRRPQVLLGAGGPAPQQPDRTSAPVGLDHTTSPDGRPPRRRRRRAALLMGVSLASVAALLFLLFGPMARVAVPDVLGRTPAEAAAILATANLKLAAEQGEFSEQVPAGQIMATDPRAADSMRTGGTVQATVSKGPERYEVPDLKNLTVAEATVALSAANLALGSQAQAFDEKVEKDRIVSSAPAAGTPQKPGTRVDVTVSKGREPIEVPDVVGSPADGAEATLKDLGLKVKRSEQFSESVARGSVISADPAAGATAYRGDRVTLVVSQGPPLVTVPNVVGKGQAAAKAELERAGFRVNVRRPLGFAIFGVNSQTPRGGTQAPKGSTITITVV